MRSDNIKRVITEENLKYGAPMGRASIGTAPDKSKVYDKRVSMCSCCGAYDIGGAYWGTGSQLRVQFSKDLTYINFYRK